MHVFIIYHFPTEYGILPTSIFRPTGIFRLFTKLSNTTVSFNSITPQNNITFPNFLKNKWGLPFSFLQRNKLL